jgi:hypothetical protein
VEHPLAEHALRIWGSSSILAGWTDELEPLDSYVFGALRVICRRLFARHCDGAEGIAVRRYDAVQFLFKTWNLLEINVIEKGMDIYEDDSPSREEQ